MRSGPHTPNPAHLYPHLHSPTHSSPPQAARMRHPLTLARAYLATPTPQPQLVPAGRPSEYGYNSAGDIVKIRRTMSGRIYGAVFERLEKIPPPVGGGARGCTRRVHGCTGALVHGCMGARGRRVMKSRSVLKPCARKSVSSELD